MNSKSKDMIMIALFSALTAVLSQIAIPLPFTPVPLNLAVFSVFLCGGLLGYKNAVISVLIYILIGAIGIPVFAGFQGGIGVLFGPTGGYIIGYIIISFFSGLAKKNNIIFMSIGLFLCYVLGTFWFMFVTKNNLLPALSMAVFPYIPGDCIKMLVSIVLTKKLLNIL